MTLKAVITENPIMAIGFSGASVFELRPEDPDDANGRQCAEDFNLRAILRAHPDLADAIVVSYNTFLNAHVFRVRPANAPKTT